MQKKALPLFPCSSVIDIIQFTCKYFACSANFGIKIINVFISSHRSLARALYPDPCFQFIYPLFICNSYLASSHCALHENSIALFSFTTCLLFFPFTLYETITIEKFQWANKTNQAIVEFWYCREKLCQDCVFMSLFGWTATGNAPIVGDLNVCSVN